MPYTLVTSGMAWNLRIVTLVSHSCAFGGYYRMIAVSEVMYRIFANVLKDLVTEWCVKKGKIPDTQFGFFPGRSTLHPLFILRHLRHAAKKLKPRSSPRLHVAFIDFSQAYDTVPRQQLWSHLRRMEYSV